MKLFSKTVAFLVFILVYSVSVKAEQKDYSDKEKSIILEQMKGTRISSITIGKTAIYADKTEKSEVLTVLPEGHFLQIMEDYSQSWYYVCEILTGQKGWVKRECIEIPKDTPAAADRMTRSRIEGFVNILKLESKTDFLVLTDINRQLTHVFNGGKGDWRLIKTFQCSTGKNESPTVRGLYTITERGEWFFSERLGSGAKHWIRFRGAYLFHSQAMDENKQLLPELNEIGQRVSNGCIRFYPDDAEWIYRNIPDNTSVFIQ